MYQPSSVFLNFARSSTLDLTLANLVSKVQQLTVQNLSASVHIRHLNESNVEQAMQSPEAFRSQTFKKQLTVNGSLKLELLPYALVCIDRASQ